MRFIEQVQYKLRTFLYDQERARYNKKSMTHSKKERDVYLGDKENDTPFHKMMSSLDEIDAYLEEKIDEWNLKIKK
nr:hypothetical protein [uncultured Niameybacter sp.]